MIFLKSVIITIIFPGTVAVWLPHYISNHRISDIFDLSSITHILTWIPIMIGISICFWCAYDFAVKGRGTPAPMDPPKELVISGMYKYIRNPMYVGSMIVILGEALFYRSIDLVYYCLIIFIVFNMFIRFYEEPTLRKLFEKSYENYLETVPRWIPKIK